MNKKNNRQTLQKNLVHYSIYAILAFIVVSSLLSFWNRYVTYDTREIMTRAQIAKALISSLEKDVINETEDIVHTYLTTYDTTELIALRKAKLIQDSVFRSIHSELVYQGVATNGLDQIQSSIKKHTDEASEIIELYRIDSVAGRNAATKFLFEKRNQFDQFKVSTFQALHEMEGNAESDYQWSILDNAIIQVILLILSIPILIIASRKLKKEVTTNESLLKQLDANNRELLFNDGTATSINANAVVGKSIASLKLAFNFVEYVSNGDYEKAQMIVPDTHRELNKKTLLGALVSMGSKLQHAEEEEKKRQWSSVGLNQFFEIVRNNQHDRTLLSDRSVSFLTKYLQSQQGSLFVLQSSDHDPHLILAACFAFDKKKYIDKRIEIGSGLVGQAFLEMQPIQMIEVPKGYTSITSGLGDATPTHLLIVPFLYNQKVEAMFEVAGFNPYQQHHIEFLMKAGEFLAATLQTVKTRAQMESLLGQSQQQTEMMRAQEEELRQNMEELEATNEAMRRNEFKSLSSN